MQEAVVEWPSIVSLPALSDGQISREFVVLSRGSCRACSRAWCLDSGTGDKANDATPCTPGMVARLDHL